MSTPLASYSFLPWLRQGLSNSIPQNDLDTNVKLRASIQVHIQVKPTLLNGSDGPLENISKSVQLYGPGDIVGIDSKSIVKVEPRNWITNFEPNYLPYIEFYDEDFPWRYTPAKANGNRLRPWITLVALSEDEFEEGKNMNHKPLPYFRIRDGKKTADLFPLPGELWAWAHVHVNEDLSEGAAANTIADPIIQDAMNDVLKNDPDKAYSRILCPRKLQPNKGYHAFLIPSFETGRLAGLGYDIPANTAATASAWDTEAQIEFPYYHRWYFRTGNTGDFEFLVNLLKPQPADKRVGVRDIDVVHPGSNLPPITNPDLLGVLKLGGALRVPYDTMKTIDKQEVDRYDQWDEHPYPHEFSTAMARRINLADDYSQAFKDIQTANQEAGILVDMENTGDPDPVITSPLYGQWHALQERLLIKRDETPMSHPRNWIHELNLDPRFRVAAGLGTKVVQQEQEKFMQSAWEQVGDILQANNKIRWAQLAKEVSIQWYSKHLLALQPASLFTFTAPVSKRMTWNNFTLFHQWTESPVPPAIHSGSFRSLVRPRGQFIKRMKLPLNGTLAVSSVTERLNNGELIMVPPKGIPTGAITLDGLAGEKSNNEIPEWIEVQLKKGQWPFTLCILAILFFLLMAVLLLAFLLPALLCVLCAVLTYRFYQKLVQWKKQMEKEQLLQPDHFTAASVDAMPMSPDFSISSPTTPTPVQRGDTDSAEAIRFKAALRDAYQLTDVIFSEPVRRKLPLATLAETIRTSLHPAKTISTRVMHGIHLPEHIKINFKEFFTPVMAYPVIDAPMYKPLAAISSELFLPNIQLIPENSITLLENNQKFIESYMVGINHEFSRELLWREYPTDQRGSCFRQFWDVHSFLPPSPVPANIKETLYDIPKIHTWSKMNTGMVNPGNPSSPLKNELGQHNNRALNGKTQLVLVIRGELLKKYPTAVVYAHRADWGLNSSNNPDIKEERRLAELTASEEQNPPLSKIKTPLFEAKVDPDIYFFGFDLDDEEARGTLQPSSIADDPGWFFVLKERPGEPRFGLDIEKAKNDNGDIRFINWNDASWPDVGTADGACIVLNKNLSFMPYNAAIDQENKPIPDDVQAHWNTSTHSAELAYILYQVPVLVAVHASRMLAS